MYIKGIIIVIIFIRALSKLNVSKLAFSLFQTIVNEELN